MENRIGAGFAGPPLHVHPDFDETFYVLDGEERLAARQAGVEPAPEAAAQSPTSRP